MMLSELVKKAQDSLAKHGDRVVMVDVEARTFEYHMAEVKRSGMALSDEDYAEDPELLEEPHLGWFILELE